MYSNSAYEALYQIIGLSLHQRFIEAITSEVFFRGLVLIIFGVLFFMTAAHFASRYLPGTLVNRKFVPLSKFIKITACLFLGVSLLRLSTTTRVSSYQGKSWHENSHVEKRFGDVKNAYKVSFAFDLLSRSAEEASALLSRIVDHAFSKTHSQLEAPAFFYKAVMHSSTATIDDPQLRETVEYYVDECLDKVLPLVGGLNSRKIDGFFGDNGQFDEALRKIPIQVEKNKVYTCLEVKNEVREGLMAFGEAKTNAITDLSREVSSRKFPMPINENRRNNYVSSALVNHFLDKREGYVGIQKGSQLPGASARIIQYLDRTFSFDALLSAVGLSDVHGASEAAGRAQKFSEHLSRAPHVAGMIKMTLIFIFPWLIFFVVAGKWRVLVFWFALYGSVLLWAPLWTLFYHIVTNIALSTEMLARLGELNDGISLYASKLVTSRIYYLYSIYSWIQILLGLSVTGLAFYFLRPLLSETQSEHMPEFVGDAGSVASTATSVATGLPKGGV